MSVSNSGGVLSDPLERLRVKPAVERLRVKPMVSAVVCQSSLNWQSQATEVFSEPQRPRSPGFTRPPQSSFVVGESVMDSWCISERLERALKSSL